MRPAEGNLLTFKVIFLSQETLRLGMSSKNEKKKKTSEVSRIAAQLAKANSREAAEMYAAAIVDPGGVTPLVFPSPCPSRAGAAMFPLVVEITTPESFGVIVSPDIDHPLRIAEGLAAAATSTPITGTFYNTQGIVSDLSIGGPQSVLGELVGGRLGFPFQTAVAQIQFNFVVEGTATSSFYGVDYYDGAVWTALGDTLAATSPGKPGVTALLTVPATTTHLAYHANTPSGLVVHGVSFTMVYSTGTGTVSPLGAISTMVTYQPDWSTVIDAAQRASVVACDCLVTFEGSTLNNGGSIAVCNTDNSLPIKESFYATIASRPHDMYRGRLASEGQTEGGAHWHYVPDDPMQLLLQDRASFTSDSRQEPHGYFGCVGKTAGEVVRIECHFLVNFYSLDPSFQMSIQPAFRDFSSLLYALRIRVPLVSSNDSHLTKLSKILRKGFGKGLDLTKAGVDFVTHHEPEIAKALALLASL